MQSISSVNVDPGDLIATCEQESNDEDCVYDIGNIIHQIVSSVKVFESPTVEHVRISDLIRHEEEQEELTASKKFSSKQRHLAVDAATLGEHWGICIAQAALILKATNQNYMRSALLPLARRYRVDHMFGQKTFNAHVYTDTIDDRVKSIHENRYGQVFATKYYFVDIYPMNSKGHCGDTLH